MPSKVERTEAEKKTKWYFVYGYFRDFNLSNILRKVLSIIGHYSPLNIQLNTDAPSVGLSNQCLNIFSHLMFAMNPHWLHDTIMNYILSNKIWIIVERIAHMTWAYKNCQCCPQSKATLQEMMPKRWGSKGLKEQVNISSLRWLICVRDLSANSIWSIY